MPFDFHNMDRLKLLLEELSELRYKTLQESLVFDLYEDSGEIGATHPVADRVKQVGIGYRWKGWDQYHWLCTKVSIPKELGKERVLGLFDFGVPIGTGNNSHFESLLYINGKPYQAVDGNHKEVFIDLEETGYNLDLKFRVWTGLNGGRRPKDMAMEIERAQFAVLDTPTDQLFFLGKTALEAHVLLEKNQPMKEWLLGTLVKAFYMIDYTHPRSETFYASTRKAYEYLDEQLQGQEKPGVTVSLLGHTHIDVAWLWRLVHTREKAARSFTTVNRMMKEHDHYVFLQSQAQLYAFIKEDYPEIYEMIRERVAQGRWEPSGSMWVECDCNLTSGESITRQILLGKNFFMDEFGYENDFLWLPDVFGYSAAMPQILQKAGVKTFITTKISWNDTNKMPYDTFYWRGIDGTEILSHFITTADLDSNSYTYNGDTRPYAIRGVWENYKNKDLNTDLLISYGYGDGGGGPNREMIHTIPYLNKIPGIPMVKEEFAKEYFDRLHVTVEDNKRNGYIPLWDGELYLEFHRGTYTSQAYNKKMNRKMEFLLRDIEILSILARDKADLYYDKETIRKAWEIVLCHQFHDILPGSSIKEVYDDSRVEYAKAQAMIDKINDEICAEVLSDKKDAFSAFNTANWVRDCFIKVENVEDLYEFTTEKGERLKSFFEGTTACVLVEKMPPLSMITIYGAKNNGKQKEFSKKDIQSISTDFYEISWDIHGHLTRIYDKENDREVLEESALGNILQVFTDKPRCFDAWEIEPTMAVDENMEVIDTCTKIEVIENEIGIFVSFDWSYYESTIHQVMCVYYHTKRIDFKTEIEWKQSQKFLKAAFPVNIRAVDARYDIQYGNVRRPITRNNSWDSAKFEVVGHKWADLWETGYGIALLNDCKYGYDMKDNTIRLSLLKSAIDPDYEADLGHHEFTYSLLPHNKEWYEADIEKEAFDLNNPVIARVGAYKFGTDSLFTVEEDHIEIDCIKEEERGKGIVLRLHEYTGARGDIHISSSLNLVSWQECDLMERVIGEVMTGPMVFQVKPYEIKTFIITCKKEIVHDTEK